jgi:hypothetical protein
MLQLPDLGAMERGSSRHLFLGEVFPPANATEVLVEALGDGGITPPRRPPGADVERWLQDARAEWTPGRSRSGRAA